MQPKFLKIFNLFLLTYIFSYTFSAQAIEIYGHRGARGLAPENTLSSYQAALAIGVDVVDMDVGMTKDGVIILSHDPILNPDITRDSKGNWLESGYPFIQLHSKQLAHYNVGQIRPKTQYANTFPIQQAKLTEKIPSLKEVIQFLKRSAPEHLRLQIEIKTDPDPHSQTASPEQIVPNLVKLLAQEQINHRVEVHSFDWRNLQILQQLAPEIPSSYLTHHQEWSERSNKLQWTANQDVSSYQDGYPELIKAMGGKIWCPYYEELNAANLKLAKQHGLKVNVWTVNDPKAMEQMIDLGVDGIITDRPDILRGLLAARSLRVPVGGNPEHNFVS